MYKAESIDLPYRSTALGGEVPSSIANDRPYDHSFVHTNSLPPFTKLFGFLIKDRALDIDGTPLILEKENHFCEKSFNFEENDIQEISDGNSPIFEFREQGLGDSNVVFKDEVDSNPYRHIDLTEFEHISFRNNSLMPHREEYTPQQLNNSTAQHLNSSTPQPQPTEPLDDIETVPYLHNPSTPQPQSFSSIIETTSYDSPPCNCSKSHCLRLYCRCFQERRPCNSLCKCLHCQNLPSKQDFVELVASELSSRKQLAFHSKIHIIPDRQTAIYAKGCHCKKTACKKKYCECLNAGVNCSDLCRCKNCENHKETIGNEAKNELKALRYKKIEKKGALGNLIEKCHLIRAIKQIPEGL